MKKKLILTLPYLFIALYATKLGEAWRLADGKDAARKVLHYMDGLKTAFQSSFPSFYPTDLLIGLLFAFAFWLFAYTKRLNQKKYRKGIEYGSARWGTAQDIKPFMDKDFQKNIILTETERLTMASRVPNPAYARNKNVLVIGGSGSGKTRGYVKPNLMQLHSSYVVTDPKGYDVLGQRKKLLSLMWRIACKYWLCPEKKEVPIMVHTESKLRMTALYERLSRDDELQGESNSILNQKKYLEDFAKSKGFTNIHHFTDDGYTGTNFNRPGFNAMLEEINAGNVATVIVKDMSRFGRNYLQVGFYTEIIFPDKGVRFIAINNGVDSANPAENDFTPFLNIMNEFYARDTSRKIKSVFKNRMQNGKRCSGAIPYGFIRHPGDKQTLFIDEQSAAVVKRIFQMAADGQSGAQIARQLTSEKLLNPAAYLERFNPENARNHKYYDPYMWNNTTVNRILDMQEYLGHTVLGKTIRDNFRSKKRRRATEDELLFFPNTHEAIISQELWDAAQKMRKRSPRQCPEGHPQHRLSGLIFCADCGNRMSHCHPASVHRPDGKTYDCDDHFQCSRYKSVYFSCTSHTIKTSVLESIILKAAQAVSQYVLKNENEFAKQLISQWQSRQTEEAENNRKELSAAKKRIAELDDLIQGLYESQIKGTLPERQYQRLMKQYDGEQSDLEKRIAELEAITELETSYKADASRFISLIRKYKDFTEMTDDMVNELIDKVVVHAATGGKGLARQQQVDVYFSFIGNFTIPQTEESIRAAKEEAIRAETTRKENFNAARKRAEQHRKEKHAALKECAKTDPKAAAEYEAYRKKKSEDNRKAAESRKRRMEADPIFAADVIAKRKQYAENRKNREHQKRLAAKMDASILTNMGQAAISSMAQATI